MVLFRKCRYRRPAVKKDACLKRDECRRDISGVAGLVGNVVTVAGSGARGFAEGSATSASFNGPCGIAEDAHGNIVLADSFNHRIRLIAPSGIVSTLAGNGVAAWADGPSTAASFNHPSDVAVDANGSIIVADSKNHCIRRIAPSGIVSTLAGNGTAAFADGPGTAASFNFPGGVALDAHGNVFVGDLRNHRIRMISPNAIVSTLAGNGAAAFGDGPSAEASFDKPAGLAVDAQGNVVVADAGNLRVRLLSPSGIVTTLAGNGAEAFVDGHACDASFNSPTGVAVDSEGNVFIADSINRRIRMLAPDGLVSTVAGNGQEAHADGPLAAASFGFPNSLAVSSDGHLLVCDNGNQRVRKLKLPVPSTFMCDMMKLREYPGDVKFIVNGQEISAHRALLAVRSEVFAAMIRTHFREATHDVGIEITTTRRREVFEALILYLYTDQLVARDDIMVDLLRLAHVYDIRRLHQLAAGYCASRISASSEISTAMPMILELARCREPYFEGIHAAARDYVVQNLRTIRETMPESIMELDRDFLASVLLAV